MSESILEQSKRTQKIASIIALFKTKKFWVFLLILFLAGFLYSKYYKNNETETTNEVTYAEYAVNKEDLKISIESDGSIKNADSVELTFGISGTVAEVFVQEGQKVSKGDKIAQLETESLEFELEKANIDLQIAQADLYTKQEGATAEEIKISQKSVESAQLSLDNTKIQNDLDIKNAEIDLEIAESNLETVQKDLDAGNSVSEIELSSAKLDIEVAQNDFDIALKNQESNKEDVTTKLEQAYEDADIKCDIALTSIRSALEEADMILEIDNDGYGMYQFSFLDTSYKINSESEYKQSSAIFEDLMEKYDNNDDLTEEEIEDKLDDVLALTTKVGTLTGYLVNGLDNTVSNSDFSVSEINSIKNSMINLQSSTKSQESNLISARQSINTAELNFDKQILSDENSVLSAQNKLIQAKQNLTTLETNQNAEDIKDDDTLLNAKKQYQIAQMQLENTKTKAESELRSAEIQLEVAEEQLKEVINPVKESDLVTLRKQIENSKINLEKAQLNLDDTLMVAPIDGEIIQMNIDAGETVKEDSEDAQVIMQSESNFEVEVYIEEADITQIELGQKVYITFESLENVTLEGTVGMIASTSTTESSGIVTYLVKVPISSKNVENIREGMTAYVEFVTAEVVDVLVVPVSAVKNRNGVPTVQMADGEYREVSTGFTDGKKVEIISGLELGEKILYKK